MPEKGTSNNRLSPQALRQTISPAFTPQLQAHQNHRDVGSFHSVYPGLAFCFSSGGAAVRADGAAGAAVAAAQSLTPSARHFPLEIEKKKNNDDLVLQRKEQSPPRQKNIDKQFRRNLRKIKGIGGRMASEMQKLCIDGVSLNPNSKRLRYTVLVKIGDI